MTDFEKLVDTIVNNVERRLDLFNPEACAQKKPKNERCDILGKIPKSFFRGYQMKIKNPKDLAHLIDHTLLKSDATQVQLEKLCREALEYGFFSVCVNSA